MARATSAQDRRAYSRLQAFMPCRVSSGGELHEGYILEASTRGAFISSRCLPPKGSAVTIIFEPPGSSETLSLHGTVMRSSRTFSEQKELGRFGVQFGRVSPESMKLIRTLLDSASRPRTAK
jgi:hypothetical protein